MLRFCTHTSSAFRLAVRSGLQRFQPLDAASASSKSADAFSVASFNAASVPRQKFIMVVIDEKEVNNEKLRKAPLENGISAIINNYSPKWR